MGDNDRIFKPRRGTKTTFFSTKANTILSEGELFFEVPDEGQGSGRGRIKMGDGSSTYVNLPYFLPFTEDEIIVHSGNTDVIISASSSIQSSSIQTNLNSAKSGNNLKTIIHNLREAIYKCACDISYLDNKAGGSYIGMVIYSTKLDTSAKVIEKYGGTTWISLSGYMLRGATSSVTANNDSKDGGNDDLIIPYHNHSFTGTATNYTSGNQSANHTHSGTTGGGGNHTHAVGCNPNGAVGTATSANLANIQISNPLGTYYTNYPGDHTHAFTTGGISANHTHTTTVTPKGTISYAGSNGNTTNANLPNYKNVYIWERTA